MAQARKTGHIEEDGASKQELHKLADRFHTVLNHPIDTTTLRGDGITAEIHEAAAKITGRSADGAADPARDTVAPKTPERVSNFINAADMYIITQSNILQMLQSNFTHVFRDDMKIIAAIKITAAQVAGPRLRGLSSVPLQYPVYGHAPTV